jgi:hypothetical protein
MFLGYEEHPMLEKLQDIADGVSTSQVIKLCLGFGAVAIAGALFLTPVLDSGSQYADGDPEVIYPGIDPITTAGVSSQRRTQRYTIRRSVLQQDPSTPCLIYEDGRREGNC